MSTRSSINSNHDEEQMHIELQTTKSIGDSNASSPSSTSSTSFSSSSSNIGHDNDTQQEEGTYDAPKMIGTESTPTDAMDEETDIEQQVGGDKNDNNQNHHHHHHHYRNDTSEEEMTMTCQCFSCRQLIGLAMGFIPVMIFALEMIPERCNICLPDVELDAYFFTAAICGGLGAVLFGNGSNNNNIVDYWMARAIGGAIAALGSLFTIWMLLQSIDSNLAFLFIFVGILGAMPGLVTYFLIKIISDICYVSDVNDYEEFAPLTKIRIVQD